MTVDWYVQWIIVSVIAWNLLLLWKLGKLLGRVAVAAVIAASITRFAWACAKVHGFRPMRFPRWMHAPAIWFELFLIELGATGRSVTHLGGRGVWNGIGDWHVFPAKEDAQ